MARANLLPTSRPRLCALQEHLHLLRHNKTGDAVLLALQGFLSSESLFPSMFSQELCQNETPTKAVPMQRRGESSRRVASLD